MNESGVIWLPNQNFFPHRYGYHPCYLVLHGTAGGTSAEAIAHYFRSTQGSSKACSTHYIIGEQGEIVQCVDEEHGAWGNGLLSAGHASYWSPEINPNLISISIEHCKPSSDNHEPLTPAQQESSFRLIRHICQRWQIPMREADASGGITGHFSIDPVNRTNCPGPYPWAELWHFLQGDSDVSVTLSDPVMASYFVDAHDGTWLCPSKNVHLYGAIRDFYCKYGGVALFGLPLTNELDDLLPGCRTVICERALIVYDPQRIADHPPIPGPCYLMHISVGKGLEYLAHPLIKTLQERLQQIRELVSQ